MTITKTLWTILILCAVLVTPSFAAQINNGKTIVPIADVSVTSSATLVRAASDIRIALSCTNTHATVHVRWGSSAVTATVGQRISAGASIEIRSTGDVYMISEGATVTMSCTEELL